MQKYEKVLNLMKSKGGVVRLDDPDLAAMLVRDEPEEKFKEGDARRTSLLYRMPTFVYSIRKFAKLEVNGIREGRKVVAYELAALATTDTPVAV
jgi:hypothetical protein